MEGSLGLLSFLDKIPIKYRQGPWHYAAHLTIAALTVVLLSLLPAVLQGTGEEPWFLFPFRGHSAPDLPVHVTQASSVPSDDQLAFVQNYRLATSIYGAGNILFMLYAIGVWPLASYTILSWNLMTVRLATAYLAESKKWAWAKAVASVTKFPALVGCTITVTVWWLVLVPLIYYLIKDSRESTNRFTRFNSSPFLINVHGINLWIAAGEFILTRQQFSRIDLWIGLAVALLYLLFYLNVLDAKGYHFYIVFTPRTGYAFFTYTFVVVLYVFIYAGWNLLI